jgi:hypothetical protein
MSWGRRSLAIAGAAVTFACGSGDTDADQQPDLVNPHDIAVPRSSDKEDTQDAATSASTAQVDPSNPELNPPACNPPSADYGYAGAYAPYGVYGPYDAYGSNGNASNVPEDGGGARDGSSTVTPTLTRSPRPARGMACLP